MAIDHNPKVFISYSWKSEEYKARVRRLADKLRGNGVDVTLDQWDLRAGHDMNAFMEMSIRDAEKVLILCESEYTARADNRKGGVGKETRIITPDVYEQYQQEKFIPVVMENPVSLPTYLKSTMAVFYTTENEEEYKTCCAQFMKFMRRSGSWGLYRILNGLEEKLPRKPKQPSMRMAARYVKRM